MKAADIATAVVRFHFPPRIWAVCPNVSWGLLPWEADLVAIGKTGRVHEIEIKISAADLRADIRKQKWKNGGLEGYVHAYWLAVPDKLEALARERCEQIGAGLIVCRMEGDRVLFCSKSMEPVKKFRQELKPGMMPEPKARRTALWRLAALRYWDHRFKQTPPTSSGKGEKI